MTAVNGALIRNEITGKTFPVCHDCVREDDVVDHSGPMWPDMPNRQDYTFEYTYEAEIRLRFACRRCKRDLPATY